MAAHNSSAIPLADVFPWSTSDPSTVLIYDTIETDGRFLVHELVRRTSCRILWLAGGATTSKLIAQGLKRYGSDDGSHYLPGNRSLSQPSRLTIRSLFEELATTDLGSFDRDNYVQNLYREIRDWCQSAGSADGWIIMDDVSILAGLLGERRVYGLILAVQALAINGGTLGIMIRCLRSLTSQQNVASSEASPWFGAGSRIRSINWEDRLVEVADNIVDVIPLSSGATREAHGRLILTTVKPLSSVFYNYCIQDSKVVVIRVRTGR